MSLSPRAALPLRRAKPYTALNESTNRYVKRQTVHLICTGCRPAPERSLTDRQEKRGRPEVPMLLAGGRLPKPDQSTETAFFIGCKLLGQWHNFGPRRNRAKGREHHQTLAHLWPIQRQGRVVCLAKTTPTVLGHVHSGSLLDATPNGERNDDGPWIGWQTIIVSYCRPIKWAENGHCTSGALAWSLVRHRPYGVSLARSDGGQTRLKGRLLRF